jgi:hypothetical protein
VATIPVSVKLLSNDANAVHIKSLTKEAAVMAKLAHPNVLHLIGMHRPGPPVMLVHEETSHFILARRVHGPCTPMAPGLC